MGGRSSSTRYEEWDSNRQRPYKHRDIETHEKIPSRRHLLRCTLNAYQKDEYPQRGRTLGW